MVYNVVSLALQVFPYANEGTIEANVLLKVDNKRHGEKNKIRIFC